MRILAPLALLGVGLTLGACADAGSCFCLVAPDSTVYFDCVQRYRAAARTPYVECRPKPDVPRVEIPGGDGMGRVPAGEVRCDPCEMQVRALGQVVRTGDDSAAALWQRP